MERRKYARLNNIEANATYRIIGEKAKSSKAARCDNINPEGLCLTFQDTLSVKAGTKLEITLEIKGNKPFTMMGEVIWVKSPDPENGKERGRMIAGIKIAEIYNDDENRFLLQLCDRMVQKLSKDFPTTNS